MQEQSLQGPKENLAKRLRDLEVKFGGPIKRARVKVSPHDPRLPSQIAGGSMRGGERMCKSGHNYADAYAGALEKYVGHPITLVEVGILAGTGLAMWADLFPFGRVVGLDVDLGHYREQLPELKDLGAFGALVPEVAEFDQLASVKEQQIVLDGIVVRGAVDVVVDDGFHSNTSITRTFKAFQPFLQRHSTYIIEDNPRVLPVLQKEFPEWKFLMWKTGPRWNDALIVAVRK